MFRKTHYILLAALTVLSCTSYKNITKEEYDVYDVIVEDQVKQVLAEWKEKPQTQIQITIPDSTFILRTGKVYRIDSKFSQFVRKHLHINCEDDFYFKNVAHYPINNNFSVNIQDVKVLVEIIPDKRMPWSDYYQKYPQAIGKIHLSRIGFSFNKKHAKVYIGRIWGPLAGLGYDIILEKQNGKWVIKNKEQVWRS